MNVLAVGCHPDDLEIGCGGTLALYAKQGHNVFMCHVANGDKGHAVIMPEELGKMRTFEAEASGAILGAKNVFNINVPDLYVNSHDEKQVNDVVEIIREVRPDIIITHSPDDYMRDHVETSLLVFNASFSSSIPHYDTKSKPFSLIAPLYYMDTLAGVGFLPEEYTDITDTIETKLEALDKHESQIKWMKVHDGIDFLDFVRTVSKFRGLQSNVKYAEGFRLCKGWPRLVTKRLLP
ncbi:MAG: PIG-L family deacetylase [Bacteroidales bacterium]|nr:PIG-L family deacetylase [Bacteroidales bacterium]